LRAAIALGVSLAPRGAMVKIALAIAALTTLGGCIGALVLSGRGSGDALVALGAAMSSALAWGAGILIAIPASLDALRDDRKSGIRALLLARGASTMTYVRGRVLGLAIVLMAVVGGGTLLSGGLAFLLASRVGTTARAFEGLVASLVYAAAFALVVAPLALATLGSRSRVGGYSRFLAIILLPELVESWTSALVPPSWGELLSVPSALGALRAALTPESLDPARFARAAFVLFVVAVLSFAFVQTEIASLDSAPRDAEDGVLP